MDGKQAHAKMLNKICHWGKTMKCMKNNPDLYKE